jgi:hypothetical protein
LATAVPPPLGISSITRFECELLFPRDLASLPDGSLRILAGLPPSGLVNYPPPATIKFDPATQVAELLSPVTGVAAILDPNPPGHLFIARPRLFRLQDEHSVERQDGEILEMDPSSGDTTVATRLLDIAPTGICADTSGTAAFGGGAVVSSLFFDNDGSQQYYLAGTAGTPASAIWQASLSEVSPLRISASPALTRIQGLAVGSCGVPTAPVLFASQPGSGTIFAVRGRVLKLTVNANCTLTATTYLSGLDRPFGLAFSSSALFVSEYGGNIVAIYL